MKAVAIKTRKFLPPKDDLWELLSSSIKSLNEKSIVVIASKIVSIAEGRAIPVSEVVDKDELISKEADRYLPRSEVPGEWVMHTIKDGIFVPTAGIDESNADGHFLLWPKDPEASAKRIWEFLRKKHKVKNLGVIISDSHSIPLRRGLVGFALSFWGFEPLRDYRGKKDLFGRELKISIKNYPDALAAAAVVVMGEGDESQPICVIEDLADVEFVEKTKTSSKDLSFRVSLDEDLYSVFLKSVDWKTGGGGD